MIMAEGSTGPAFTNSTVEELVRRSPLIFRGTIQQLHAATMSVVPVDDATAVVHVERVLDAPSTLADPTGRDITVQLRATDGAAVRQGAIFFTTSWLYGESLAVVEVSRIPVP